MKLFITCWGQRGSSSPRVQKQQSSPLHCELSVFFFSSSSPCYGWWVNSRSACKQDVDPWPGRRWRLTGCLYLQPQSLYLAAVPVHIHEGQSSAAHSQSCSREIRTYWEQMAGANQNQNFSYIYWLKSEKERGPQGGKGTIIRINHTHWRTCEVVFI